MFVAFIVDSIVWFEAPGIKFHDEDEDIKIEEKTTTTKGLGDPAMSPLVSSKEIEEVVGQDPTSKSFSQRDSNHVVVNFKSESSL